MENIPLIEISFEDDFLIPSSSQEFGIHTGCTLEAGKIEERENFKEVPHLSVPPEQNQKVSDRYNLRKSLAWDSAFFTGEGILNPEELATMNNTHSKAGITLPGIQELRKSSESSSTFESDNWALEHLEVNLFDNVRDSIPRSLGSSNHTTNMVHYDKIKRQMKPDAPNARTLKKIDDSSDIKHSQGNAESRPLIRPPKASSKTIPLPATVPGEKASIGINERKGVTAKQQSIVAFNKATGIPGVAPRTTLSTNPSGSQTGLVLKATLGKSCSSLTTSSFDLRSVSTLAKAGKRSTNRIRSYSSSRTGKTPLNISINGSTLENHHQNLAKSSLVQSKISPASSIDTVVSESSSSTSSTKLGKSLEGSDAGSSSSSVAFSSTLGVSQNSGSLSQLFIEDRTKSYKNGDCSSRLARPSGLRMPRPTVGYFDKGKTQVRGSSKIPKPSLQNYLKKSAGVNYTGATNKVKPIDLPTVRDGRLPSALSKQVLKSAKVNSLTKIENHQKLCLRVNKISSEIVEYNCKKKFNNEPVPTDKVEKVQSCNSNMKEEPNLLHPNVFARENETETIGEQKTHYHSHRTHNQLENMLADSEIEKENKCHELKTEDPFKMLKMEVLIGGEDALPFTF